MTYQTIATILLFTAFTLFLLLLYLNPLSFKNTPNLSFKKTIDRARNYGFLYGFIMASIIFSFAIMASYTSEARLLFTTIN
jgi:hypothetical protein